MTTKLKAIIGAARVVPRSSVWAYCDPHPCGPRLALSPEARCDIRTHRPSRGVPAIVRVRL